MSLTSRYINRCLMLILICFGISSAMLAQIEICDNGIDDDGDSLIDINDDDCICEVIEPVSVIPNPSFEEMNCCPDDRSQLDCAALWIQASLPTTDYIHTCDWLGWDDFPPPQPFPDGDGIMGFRDGRVRSNNEAEPYWKEYAGACLITPLTADSSYRFQFDVGFVDAQKSPPIDISFFGTTDCDNLPFGLNDQSFGCPSNSPRWEKLAEVTVSGGTGNTWVNTFIEFVPDEDIYAIAIGPDCAPVSTPISIYYFFDNLLLTNLESFDFQISENLHPCNSDFTLSVPNNPDFEYQWYKSGVALEGEIFSELTQHYGEGSYQVRILNGSSCRITTQFEYRIPEINVAPNIAICEGDFYPFGDTQLSEPGFYLDTLISKDNCDSIVGLELEVIGDQYDTLAVSIFAGDSYEIGDESLTQPGEYPLILTSSLGCDSLVLLNLSLFNIYIPNVFTPESPGLNNVFAPDAPEGEIESVEMNIYNRWGNHLFRGAEWKGRNQPAGVYVYRIDIDFKRGITHSFYGTVTLIK